MTGGERTGSNNATQISSVLQILVIDVCRTRARAGLGKVVLDR